ncbi:FG-GAP repeat domain-containing protein [Prauserella alba]|uniref:FG-GAP repeat domain-containing protein n=1 Tax=Prauserella alba TaxID=176898 RepID=UPI0020A2B020|nr:VCBS repeat-containing protein [Prauserella alba]
MALVVGFIGSNTMDENANDYPLEFSDIYLVDQEEEIPNGPDIRAVGPYWQGEREAAPKAVPFSASGGRAGDFTGDGIADLMARNADTGNLLIYPGSGSLEGTATYGEAVKVFGDTSGFDWMGQGDFNGDGLADFIGTDPSGQLGIAYNSGGLNGENTFDTVFVVGGGWQDYDLRTTGDFNGDGIDDLLVRRTGTGDVYVATASSTGSGDVTLEPPVRIVTGLDSAVNMQYIDVTGDDAPDLLFQWEPNGYLYLYDFYADQDSSGNFIAKLYALSSGWEESNATIFADMNMDRSPDLIVRSVENGNLVGIPHSGNWNFARPQDLFTLDGSQIIGADWNRNDIVT